MSTSSDCWWCQLGISHVNHDAMKAEKPVKRGPSSDKHWQVNINRLLRKADEMCAWQNVNGV